ncbi:hypothetical protein DSM112329_01001 [Paraconexibacter sp. AEG42_29]|uniref:Uncharacterized protein n=1 Tax=Paraconexibacter sp. AEG42_29 TaxID=2997339 RepID=A0AAU7ARA3_9ACTN
MLRPRRALLTLLAAGGLAFAGCGGDDDGGGDQALAKKELAAKADAICVGYDKKEKELEQPTDKASTIKYLEVAVPLVAGQADDLAKLKPADDVKAEWDQLMKDFQAGKTAALAAQKALVANDEAAYTKVIEGATEIAPRRDKEAIALGAPNCGADNGAA